MTNAENKMSRNTRILLVDDNELFSKHLSFRLDREPDLMVVATAKTGYQAVAKARMYQPDLILLDMVMTGLDGFDAIPLLREAVPRAVIIVLSSLEEDDYVDGAIGSGPDADVKKASMTEKLLLEIKRLRNTR